MATKTRQIVVPANVARGALDRVSRIELQNHLEQCVIEQVTAVALRQEVA